jgi:diguanylate cyclase (GGDEF)-like protein
VRATKRRSNDSLLVRSTLLYVLLTAGTVVLFVLLVFENQLDLIAENAVLKSRLAGTRLERFASQRLAGVDALDELPPAFAGELEREAGRLGIETVHLYDEQGTLYLSFGAAPREEEAATAELRRIHQALTRRDFENRLFHHELDRSEREIDLYIPITFGSERAVAAATIYLHDVDRSLRLLYRQSALMAGLIIALHLLFAVLLGRMILRPLRRLSGAIERVSAGELQTEIAVDREDEIGRLAATFNHMSRNVRRMREEARGANPLTGLPGNIRIASLMDAYLFEDRPFAVVYADLDNFKAYNDAYGFARGDNVILFLRDCLLRAADEAEGEFFVGHEGGDDFVVICGEEAWEPYVEHLMADFDAGAGAFYTEADRARGSIVATDRDGTERRFPLVTVSVAVVTTSRRGFSHHAEVIEAAAEVKKVAKKREGSSYVVDRRGSAVEEARRAASGEGGGG